MGGSTKRASVSWQSQSVTLDPWPSFALLRPGIVLKERWESMFSHPKACQYRFVVMEIKHMRSSDSPRCGRTNSLNTWCVKWLTKIKGGKFSLFTFREQMNGSQMLNKKYFIIYLQYKHVLLCWFPYTIQYIGSIYILHKSEKWTARLPSRFIHIYIDCIFKKNVYSTYKTAIWHVFEAVTRCRCIVKKSLKNSSVR